MSGRRRSQGEGSVFKRKDGLWSGAVDLGWVNGKRIRKTVYGKTEKEVLGKLAELKDAQRKGQNLAARPRKFAEWLDEWIEMKKRQGTRPLTLRGYRQLIHDHVKPALGRKQLDKLTPTDVRRLIEAKAESGLSAATVKQVHGLIRNALADAEREELIHRNVAKLVKPPSVKRDEARVLTIEEAKSLINTIKGDRLEAFWICALTLGLRRGELLGLRWEDIDFGKGLLAVRQSLQRADGSLQLVDPKTSRSRRAVPVPEPTLAALRKHKREQAAEQLAAGERWKSSGLVFASTIGTPIEPGNLSTRWRKTRAKAGLDWLRLHDLRHACASFLIACGASPRTVMKTLGHSQIGLTMNTYAHVLPGIEREAVDAVAKKLFG
ncbi:tyrosine-type recombinase/integrase [Sphaerisporangium sp. TRM90804]|uniref:tyrosine-type recombinase/integrase n=1 Tax=Sphaerisporangium sp. TRM90804 TaxID=3031113 RepID=UPI002448EE3F|nr:tyrosine-type recombinase/integrase [Sphaerisporangium sp. TRM90804]MDH2429289.1 tyrosine-type recombinase/integrase [Sphaerisporangium sp. TRM90804]